MNNDKNLSAGLEPFKTHSYNNREKELLRIQPIKAFLMLFIVFFSFQSSAQYVLDTGGTFSGSVDFQQGLRVLKNTGSSVIDPATITIRSNSSASDWVSTSTWGNLDFFSNDASGIGKTVRARIGSYMATANGTRAGLKFFTSDNTTFSERLAIDPYGFVGIGVSNPLGLLHLSTSTTGGTVNANYDNLIIEQNSGNSGMTFLSRNNQIAGISFSDDLAENQGIILYNHNSDNMAIYTDGQERLRVNEDGNLGIGTTAPDVRLEVTGGLGLSDLTSGKGVVQIGAYSSTHMSFDGNDIQVSSNGSVENLLLQKQGGFIGIGTNAPNALVHIAQDAASGLRFSRDNHDSYEFYLSGSNGLNIRNQTDARDEMVFLGNGNIGVGTSNPSELFTINQGSSASGLSLQRDGYDDYNLLLQGGKGLYIRNGADGRDEMVFDGTGKVAIGHSAPEKELDVAGDLVVGKSGHSGKVFFKRSLDGTIRGFVGFSSGSDYQNIVISNETGGGFLTFKTNNGSSTQERLRIDADGNLGIGTASPTQKLSVDGKINAEEIILEDVAGADFVFEEDYDLRSLEATEQFIKANKHLPEVPSAAEMAEEGLAIKEMNILLLQKIEELTLHMIRQEKEMQQMQTRIIKQDSKIDALEQAQNND